MKRIHPTITLESWERAAARKHYHRATVALVTLNRRPHILEIGAGSNDDINAWKDSAGAVYVLCTNYGLNYAGLSRYESTNAPDPINPKKYATEETGSAFVQSMDELTDALPNGLDHAPATIMRALMEHLP